MLNRITLWLGWVVTTSVAMSGVAGAQVCLSQPPATTYLVDPLGWQAGAFLPLQSNAIYLFQAGTYAPIAAAPEASIVARDVSNVRFVADGQVKLEAGTTAHVLIEDAWDVELVVGQLGDRWTTNELNLGQSPVDGIAVLQTNPALPAGCVGFEDVTAEVHLGSSLLFDAPNLELRVAPRVRCFFNANTVVGIWVVNATEATLDGVTARANSGSGILVTDAPGSLSHAYLASNGGSPSIGDCNVSATGADGLLVAPSVPWLFDWTLDAVQSTTNCRDGFHFEKIASVSGAGAEAWENGDDGFHAYGVPDFQLERFKADENGTNLSVVNGSGIEVDAASVPPDQPTPRVWLSAAGASGTASFNGGHGIQLSGPPSLTAAVTLQHIDARSNQGGSGLDVVDADTLTVDGGIYEDNHLDGIIALRGTAVLIDDVTSNDNLRRGAAIGSVDSVSVHASKFSNTVAGGPQIDGLVIGVGLGVDAKSVRADGNQRFGVAIIETAQQVGLRDIRADSNGVVGIVTVGNGGLTEITAAETQHNGFAGILVQSDKDLAVDGALSVNNGTIGIAVAHTRFGVVGDSEAYDNPIGIYGLGTDIEDLTLFGNKVMGHGPAGIAALRLRSFVSVGDVVLGDPEQRPVFGIYQQHTLAPVNVPTPYRIEDSPLVAIHQWGIADASTRTIIRGNRVSDSQYVGIMAQGVVGPLQVSHLVERNYVSESGLGGIVTAHNAELMLFGNVVDQVRVPFPCGPQAGGVGYWTHEDGVAGAEPCVANNDAIDVRGVGFRATLLAASADGHVNNLVAPGLAPGSQACSGVQAVGADLHVHHSDLFGAGPSYVDQALDGGDNVSVTPQFTGPPPPPLGPGAYRLSPASTIAAAGTSASGCLPASPVQFDGSAYKIAGVTPIGAWDDPDPSEPVFKAPSDPAFLARLARSFAAHGIASNLDDLLDAASRPPPAEMTTLLEAARAVRRRCERPLAILSRLAARPRRNPRRRRRGIHRALRALARSCDHIAVAGTWNPGNPTFNPVTFFEDRTAAAKANIDALATTLSAIERPRPCPLDDPDCLPCNGAAAPACNGRCASGFECRGAATGAGCICVEERMACAPSQAPTCDGACPPGQTCNHMATSDLCECLPAHPCGDSFPACNGACLLGFECQMALTHPGCTCRPVDLSCGAAAGPSCNGECPPHQQCTSQGGGACGCVVAPCELSEPTCGGICSGGGTCITGAGGNCECLIDTCAQGTTPWCIGECPPGQACSNTTPNGCLCRPEGSCGAAQAPACAGYCLPGYSCGHMGVNLCECVADTIPCGTGSICDQAPCPIGWSCADTGGGNCYCMP